MHTDLRSFLHSLREAGDLVEVEAEVDPHLELPEVHRRVIAAGGPALLFRNVRGSPFSLATNLFGTRARVDRAFGTAPADFVAELAGLVKEARPPGLADLWERRGWVRRGLGIGTRGVVRGPVTERVTADPDLEALPFTTSWPEDGGPFLTLPLVYTQHPDSGGHNLGMYRIQRHDRRTTGIHWQIGKGGGFHYSVAEARDQALPAVIHLGGPPALVLAAIVPLPENVPELLLASLLQGERLEMVSAPLADHPLPIVARAEAALIGWVPPKVRRPEGPFGDHYGYYSLEHDYPVFRCRALAHRRDAVIPATVVGKPRQEDFYIGDYLQELLSPIFPLVMPAVTDLWSYGETGFHSLAAAVVKERYPGEALGSAFRILGEGQLSLTKFLLVTDAPQDLRDFRSTLEHVLARVRFETDLRIFTSTSMDTLDYAGPKVNQGSKGVLMGLGDPVRELPGVPPPELPRCVERAEVFCPGCLVVEGASYQEAKDLPSELAREGGLAGYPLVVLTDRGARATRDTQRFLWVTFTRFNPETDLHPGATELRGHHLSYQPPLVLDARMKPWYPGEVLCDPGTRATVDRRWTEYFPAGGVEMGESE